MRKAARRGRKHHKEVKPSAAVEFIRSQTSVREIYNSWVYGVFVRRRFSGAAARLRPLPRDR